MKKRLAWIAPAIVVLAATTVACGQEINVALATAGATVRTDSDYIRMFRVPSVATFLTDGVIPEPGPAAESARWHSEPGVHHPHWIWIRFARPATISRVVLWYSDIGAPVDFSGQCTFDGGCSVQTLFHKENAQLDTAHPSLAIEFPAVVTDNFRLLITRSSDAAFPNYTQLGELQVFGQWAGEPAATLKPTANRQRGEIKDGPLPEGLAMESTENEVAFISPWLKVAFDLNRPGIRGLSLDGSGSGKHVKSLLKGPDLIDAIVGGWNAEMSSADASFTVSRFGNTVRYSGIQLGGVETLDLVFTVEPKNLRVTIDRHVPADYTTMGSSPLRMLFDGGVTPPSPMGRLKAINELMNPILLHFPDHGTLLVRCTGADSTWKFFGPLDQRREVRLSLQQGISVTPDAVMRQQAGRYHAKLDMAVTSIYPEKAIVDADPKLAGVKRGWLNIFGFRPDIASLANNSLSDNAIMCMYEFADQAYYTPPLFDDFTALDLVRMSLDSFFDLTLPNYARDVDRWTDSDPSIVISAWDYATGKPDRKWLERRIGHIEKHADHIIAADINGDGLAESSRTGNSGSGPNGAGEWSCNWWDVISFGWNDAYSAAQDYRAFRCAADLEDRLGRTERAELYRKRAAQIKDVYYATFYNPQTGVLAGWRSKDGQLHDYYFTFVTGIAIAYGLVTPEQGNAMIDRMQAKMREVGYTNFRIGLPGNLIPIARKDYAGDGVMGQPSKDDGSDSFQNYENGGATASFAYFYVQALYTLGRKAEADAIVDAMLEGYRDGVFQNGVGSGVDWKRWDGTPCGYEGLLADTYYALTAVITGRLGKGIPIP